MSPEKQRGGRIQRSINNIEIPANPKLKPPDPQKLLRSFRELTGQDEPQEKPQYEPQEQIPKLQQLPELRHRHKRSRRRRR